MDDIKDKIEMMEGYICLFKEIESPLGQTLYEEFFGETAGDLSEILERIRYKQEFQITEGEEIFVNKFIKFINSLNDALVKIEEKRR